MGTYTKVKSYFKEESTLFKLLKVLSVLLIVYLLSLTWSVWSTIFRLAITALKPFIFGFIIAYVLNPMIEFLQSKGVKKGLAIFLIMILAIGIFGWLLVTLIPMLYEEFLSLLNSIGSSLEVITKWYFDNAKDPSVLFSGIINQLESSFSAIQKSIVEVIGAFITNFISSSMSMLTTTLFSITITIYMLSDFQKFKDSIKKLSSKISITIPKYLEEIDVQMGSFVKSELMLMTVYFIEYTTIYYIMGHKGYLMIGILYVILGTLVPYVGGMIVTAIGILTGLTMPLTNLIILMVLVMIMSQIDGYVTSPMIYKKGVKIEPLTSLLVIFIGSALFGAVGVLLAMPTYVVIRAIIHVNREDKKDSEEKNQENVKIELIEVIDEE